MMFLNKYNKFNFTQRNTSKKCFTYDDALEMGIHNENYNNVLKLKNMTIKLWAILDDIEKILYKDKLNVIMKNKPIFEKQKHTLILLDSQIENIYKYGLLSSIKKYDNSIQLDNIKFNIDTIFNDWNNLATKANIEIDILKSLTIRENNILTVINSINSFKDTKNDGKIIKSSRNIFKYFIIMIIMLIIIFVCYLYKDLLYAYL